MIATTLLGLALAAAPVPVEEVAAQFGADTQATNISCTPYEAVTYCYGVGADGAVVGATFADGVFTPIGAGPAAAPTTTAAAAAAAAPATYAAVTSDDLRFTVLTVQDSVDIDNMFLEPAEGNRLIGIEIEIVNEGDDEKTFSPLMLAEVVDANGQAWSAALVGPEPDIGGSIPAGQSRRGWMAFEVPEGIAAVELWLSGGLLDDSAVVTL